MRNYESSIYIQFYDQQRLLNSAVHSPNMYIGAMDFLNLVEAHLQIINICLLMWMYLFCLLYVQEKTINIFIDFTTTNSSQSHTIDWQEEDFFQSFNNIIWQSYHHIININIKQFCNLDLNLFYKKSNHLQRHFINIVYMNSCIVTPNEICFSITLRT